MHQNTNGSIIDVQMKLALKGLAAVVLTAPFAALAAAPVCQIASGERLTPVIELYTSEGCSSCPPADQWLSRLKGQPVVAQAFHVAYWDYIGWKDRFASPAFTTRQKEVAAFNGLNGIYTPQLVRNGRDWRNWGQAGQAVDHTKLSRAAITLQRSQSTNGYEARVVPSATAGEWAAYWTVTEHGHSSRVKAGENAGEFLTHDFVVIQYTPVGRYQGAQSLKFFTTPAQPQHPRQINLVVSDARTGEPLQAVSLQCG